VDGHVDRLLGHPEATGLFIDFDGTIARIVAVPSEARPIEGAADLVARLADKFRLTAVVSGRSAVELVDWLGPGIEIWGLHGAERAVDGRVEMATRASSYVPLMQDVRREVAERLPGLGLDGVLLEDKGVMLTLHYRAASDPGRAHEMLRHLVTELVSRRGLIEAEGKMAFELRPPLDFSKATVVLERSTELRLDAVAFAGDDVVDLPAFDALDVLATRGAATVRVAVASREAPSELLERADVVVEGPDGMLEWLRLLVD
jgi:trehalose 6-phosphate phosphatase